MKKIVKIFSIIVCALTVLALSAIGYAETYAFKITVSGSEVATVGEEFTYTFSLDDVKVEGGILGFDVNDVSFDTDILQYVKSETSTLSGWDIKVNSKNVASGKLEFHATNDGAAATPKNGAIKFSVTFKVLDTSEKSTKVTLKLFQVADSTTNPVKTGNVSDLTIKIKHTLPTPSNPHWDGTTAKWDAVEGATTYQVQLYNGSSEYGDSVSASTNEKSFDTISEGGKYTFTVIAISDDELLGDSNASAKSDERTVKGKLVSPTVKLSSNIYDGGFKFQITDKNASGSVSGYVLKIYSGNDAVKTVELGEGGKAGEIALDDKIIGGSKYSATVTAKSGDEEIYLDSDEGDKSAEITADKLVKSIDYEYSPEISYVEGTVYNFSSVSVKLTYDDDTTKIVKYSDFEKNGIEFNFENGEEVQTVDNGKKITASFGNLSVSTAKIAVSESTCKHTQTHTDHKDPTCGEDGYDNVVCDDCGATISAQAIPATGEHVFGEWEVTLEATATRKGLKERTCSVCHFNEAMEIAPTGGNDDETTVKDDDTTSSVTTKPADVTDKNGGGTMENLSRIFLIVVIVLFVIIVIIIIFSIYAEKQREKKRRQAQRARARRRPPQE